MTEARATRQLVYIVGPYAAEAPEGIEQNVSRALALAKHAAERGLCPIIPHLTGRAGVYGHEFESDDGTSRRVALECGAAMATWVGRVGGTLWVILRNDGTMSPGTQVEYDAYRAVGGTAIVSANWLSWRSRTGDAVGVPDTFSYVPDASPCDHGASGGNVGFANGSCTNCGAPDLGFYMVDGTEDDWPALGCDCYPGCWGQHSAQWPKIVFAPAGSYGEAQSCAEEAHRLCHQEKEKYVPRPATDRLPHGSYVLVGTELRFASKALRNAHEARLRALWPIL